MLLHPMVEEILSAQEALSPAERKAILSSGGAEMDLHGVSAIFRGASLFIPCTPASEELRKRLLTRLHVAVLHAGEAAALRKLTAAHLFVPNFKPQYQEVRKDCVTCAISRVATGAAPEKGGGLIPPPYAPPFQMLQMDAAKFVQSLEGYVGFYLICCVTSRTLRIAPFKELNSTTAAEALVSWCRSYPSPTWLITDGGSENRCEVDRVCKELNIMHYAGTPHHHSPRMAESFIGRVKTAFLRSIPGGKIALWPHYVGFIEHALKLLPLDSLGGISPMEYAFGVRPDPLVLDGILPGSQQDHLDALEALRSFADYASEIGKFRGAAVYNASHPVEYLKVGDWVMVYDPNDKRMISSAYSTPYEGPFVITDVEAQSAGRARGSPTGFYTVQLLLAGTTAESVRTDPSCTKRVFHQRCHPIPKGDGSVAAYHLAITHAGSHLVERVVDGPFFRSGGDEPYFEVAFLGVPGTLCRPFSHFADLQVEGKDPVTTNPVILRYLADKDLAPSGKSLPAKSGRLGSVNSR